jgi:alkylated DNA repair dioxygenase AlkB
MTPVPADLFNLPVLPGLSYQDAIITQAEESVLIAHLDELPLAPFRLKGWLGKRRTASFGGHYGFERAAIGPAQLFPTWLLPLKRRAANFARLQDSELVQALLIRYDPDAGIGWHRDRSVFEHVLGISLGANVTMRSRRRRVKGFGRAAALLACRSVYHLSGEARHGW